MIQEQIGHRYDFIDNSVPPINQLLIFLRFCATGSHLPCIADFNVVHLSTVSQIVVRVGRALANLRNRFIKMPQTQEELSNNKLAFYERARFPRVIGVLDYTHVKIQSPGENEEVFRNRKGYFSIKVQAVANADLKIMNIVARWPGAAHDATIFNNSRIKEEFENNVFSNSLLLGDSSHFLRPYLLTPLLNPVTRAEQIYNEAHIRTRNTVEGLFGVWKTRFPILAYGYHLKLDTVLMLVVAVAVVYNICKENNEEEPPDPEDIARFLRIMQQNEVPNVLHNPDYANNQAAALGNETRRNLIENFVGNLE